MAADGIVSSAAIAVWSRGAARHLWSGTAETAPVCDSACLHGELIDEKGVAPHSGNSGHYADNIHYVK